MGDDIIPIFIIEIFMIVATEMKKSKSKRKSKRKSKKFKNSGLKTLYNKMY
uniref:Uncharacterized protein n=1 Tax=viral metagenome TaxID=1070528 RepID=A0A6C0K3L5_9ZZZZ